MSRNDDRPDPEDEDDRDEADGREPAPEEEEESPAPRRKRRRERAVVLFADQGGSIIRAGDESLDEESLPVLTAFRQFLEAERKRARRQMVILIACFTVAVLALAGGGGWYVWTILKRMENGMETDKVRFEEERLAAVTNLQNVAHAAVTLRKDVLDTRKTSTVLQQKVSEQSGELSKLLDTITGLEIQNALLQNSVRKLDEKSEPPEPPPDFPAPLPDVRAGPVQPPVFRAPPPVSSVEPVPAPAANPAAPAVSPSGSPGGVPFRLPLPRE